MVHDKTMSKLEELSRSISETFTFLDGLFSSSSMLIAIANTSGLFVKVSQSWGVLGWTPQELCLRPYMEFVHPDDVANTNAVWLSITEHGRSVDSFRNRYRHKDGRYSWLRWCTNSTASDNHVYSLAEYEGIAE